MPSTTEHLADLTVAELVRPPAETTWPARGRVVLHAPAAQVSRWVRPDQGTVTPRDAGSCVLEVGSWSWPSLVAWPTVSRGIDLLVSVDDEPAREAMRLAARSGIVSGETGAAGLGGLLELLRAEEGEEARRTLGVSGEISVLLFNCEGATDPDAYRRVMAG